MICPNCKEEVKDLTEHLREFPYSYPSYSCSSKAERSEVPAVIEARQAIESGVKN